MGKHGKRTFKSRHLCKLLPALHRHTQGSAFRLFTVRTWLRCTLSVTRLCVPPRERLGHLFRYLARRESSLCAWVPCSIQYTDQDGSSDVDNVKGFVQRTRMMTRRAVAWEESGFVYRVQVLSDGAFKIVKKFTGKSLGCAVKTHDLPIVVGGKHLMLRRTLMFNPCSGNLKPVKPAWSMIYLHGFGMKGTDYINCPHYFLTSGANVRVVLPTAPLQEQGCFNDWHVWRGERLGWRRIQFNSWFNYTTDRGGRSENDLDLSSLLEMREKLFVLVHKEVQRMGGDPRRVIIGGKSQGCCMALDVAMNYPDELGGVIGLVGHCLGCTTLNESKRSMPLHLFHEDTDKEMNWAWVEPSIQRLRNGGFNVISRREHDHSGQGHWIQEIEGKWIRSGLRCTIAARSPDV